MKSLSSQCLFNFLFLFQVYVSVHAFGFFPFYFGGLLSLVPCVLPLAVCEFLIFFLNLSYFYNVLWTNETKVKMFDDNAQHHI